ncbi:hypothetical protein DMC63_01735 [Streptomyces sp. WAC 05977]|nr:hypothetical protein DMC63_01735 [Streptomyces sp. WAC 05977]
MRGCRDALGRGGLVEDRRLETHPDLMDPDWREHAEVDAWLGAKKDLKKRRKQASRRGFAAARLGSRALQHADGSELLRLLTPNERVRLEPVLTSRLKVEKGKYLTLIGPHRLLQVSPRMTGFLTSKAGEKGELVVHASYTTAYAFDAHPGEARSPSDIVPFVRDEQDYVIRKAPPFAEADAGLSFGEGAGYHSHMACDALKAGILAPQYSDKSKPVDGALAVDEVDTYDPTKPLPSTGNCG